MPKIGRASFVLYVDSFPIRESVEERRKGVCVCFIFTGESWQRSFISGILKSFPTY